MNKVEVIVLTLFALISNQAHSACSPSVSESKAGGNIVITNNCGLSDEAVLKQLENFKAEQSRNSNNQSRNQREIIRQFNKNQQETAAKLDEILTKVQSIGIPPAQETSSTQPNDIATHQETPLEENSISEEALAIKEQNYKTIIDSIKMRRLVFQEELVAQLLTNQSVILDCKKISEIIAEARNQNRYTTISLSFIEHITPLVSLPLSPTCFQELTKNLDLASADRVISTIKSTKENNAKADSLSRSTNSSINIPRSDAKNQTAIDSQVRQIVRSLSAALGKETGGYRLEAIRHSIESLPNNLSADEIKLIIGEETGGYKRSILEVLSQKIQNNSLDSTKITSILGPDEGGNRHAQIILLAPYIRPTVDANDMTNILLGLYSSQRSEIISLLSGKIRTPLSEDAIRSILGDITGEARRSAINSLIRMQAQSFEPTKKASSPK